MVQLPPIDTAVRAFSSSPISDEEAAAMFRATINLFAHWSLTDKEAAAGVEDGFDIGLAFLGDLLMCFRSAGVSAD